MMEGPHLLHNVAGPARSIVSHRGRRVSCRLASMCLPTSVTDCRGILALIDGRDWPGGEQGAELELRRRITRHIGHLRYPAAALLVRRAEAAGLEPPPDPLTVCAVLARSSEHVYLRDKEPSIAAIFGARDAALQFPLRKGTK